MSAAGALLAATLRASRSPWVWTPAAVGTAGLATATIALGRVLTAPALQAPARVHQQWLLTVTPTRPGFVRLQGPASGVRGRWGVEYPGGAGEVGEPVDGGGSDAAERPFTLLAGNAPTAGTRGALRAHVWTSLESFTAATGLAGTETVVHGETGPLPAWVFPAGAGRRWCVLVHGRGAPRAQMLRLVPALHAQGITAMVISYRNDAPDCFDPSGRTHFGHREWRDLDVAVAAAQEAGAQQLILAGMSMGGGIIATFLRRSERAPAVVAAILDAPALNWGPILRHVARGRRVPGWLVPGVMAAAAWQARIDWQALNHLGSDQRLTTPVLLIHGSADPVVPVELSDAYADAEPDLVTYLRVPDAGHVSAWNTDPQGYGRALDEFLTGPAAIAAGV